MFTSYILNNYKFKNCYNNYFCDVMDKYDLSNIDINIILFLANNPSLNSAKDIVNYRGLAKSNVSTSLTKLEDRGIVIYKNDSVDKRKINIYLDKNHQTMINEIKAKQQEFIKKITKGLSQEELDVINVAMEKMIANLDEIGD